MTPALVAHGMVDASGQLRLDARSSFAQDVKRFAGKRIVLTVEEEQDVRTLAQNKRFWLICQYAADAWSVGLPLPIHKEEAKQALCRAFLGVVQTPLSLEARGTKHLSVAEMAELQEKITAHFAAEGTPLPLDGFA